MTKFSRAPCNNNHSYPSENQTGSMLNQEGEQGAHGRSTTALRALALLLLLLNVSQWTKQGEWALARIWSTEQGCCSVNPFMANHLECNLARMPLESSRLRCFQGTQCHKLWEVTADSNKQASAIAPDFFWGKVQLWHACGIERVIANQKIKCQLCLMQRNVPC